MNLPLVKLTNGNPIELIQMFDDPVYKLRTSRDNAVGCKATTNEVVETEMTTARQEYLHTEVAHYPTRNTIAAKHSSAGYNRLSIETNADRRSVGSPGSRKKRLHQTDKK